MGGSQVTAATPAADAALIALCGVHLAALHAFNTAGGDREPEACPLHAAYFCTLGAVRDARPTTAAGAVALARVAVAEATKPDGSRCWQSTAAGEIAGNIVEALAGFPA